VGAVSEVLLGEPHQLVPPRDPARLALALKQQLEKVYDPHEISAALTRPDWDGSARLLHHSLLEALTGSAREAA
jgi:hypothetical protein